ALDDQRWKKVSADVAAQLVTTKNPFTLSGWTDALRPARHQLLDPLVTIFRDVKRTESERSFASYVVAEYVVDNPKALVTLLMDADGRQFAPMFSQAKRHPARAIPFLEAELGKKPDQEAAGVPRGELAKRQANAVVALIRMGRLEKAWPLLK